MLLTSPLHRCSVNERFHYYFTGILPSEEGRSNILAGRTCGSEDGGQEVGMSTLRKGSMKFGEGMGRGRSEWRVDVREVLGLIGNFLHRETLACLALLL